MFQAAAWLISQFYALTHNYAIAIALVAVVIMLLLLPLTLKSTKSMLEMQRLQPEMRRLQQQHRGDRQKLNEETMKLYQEHKVNPMASCLPLLAQMPIFFIMFRVLHKLTETRPARPMVRRRSRRLRGCRREVRAVLRRQEIFDPSYISTSSDLYQSLLGKNEMISFGLDLAARPIEVIQDSPGKGIIYALLVIFLGALYFIQQRMVASHAPATACRPAQQKIMQYLPVGFAFFQLFFPVGLVIYYITQTLVRIGQQAYITQRFYRGDHSLGKQAQAAGAKAREMAKEDGGGTGLMASLRQDAGPKPRSRTRTRPRTPRRSRRRHRNGRRRRRPSRRRPVRDETGAPNRPKPSGSSRHQKPSKP